MTDHQSRNIGGQRKEVSDNMKFNKVEAFAHLTAIGAVAISAPIIFRGIDSLLSSNIKRKEVERYV